MTAGTFLPVSPLSVQRVSRRRAYATAREQGFVARRQVQEREVRAWRLSWQVGTRGEAELTWDAWAAAAG